MNPNPPLIQEIDNLLVVRDDLLPGGTKRRALPVLMKGKSEYVYASPVYGYGQVALAHVARESGKRATVFVRSEVRGTRERLRPKPQGRRSSRCPAAI